MSQSTRETIALLILAVALLALCGWGYGYCGRAKAAATAAGSDLVQTRRYAAEIERFRDRPSLGAGSDASDAVTRLVESAAAGAAVPPASLVRVWPEAARRVGDTPYQEKPTQVLLRGVNLQQLTTFLHRLTVETESGLAVKSVRLVAPRGEEEGDQWTAETTLTHLIYVPQHAGPTGDTP